MSAPTKVPLLSQADRRRLLIVAKAADLFDDVGYTQTSMDDIARSVQMAKPTLYHYFSGKDEILFSIHEEFLDLLISRQGEREALELPASGEIFEVMADILDLMDTHRGHVRVFFEHHRELPDDKRAVVAKKRSEYQAYVTRLIEKGIRDGEFRPTDAVLTTLAIFGMCNWAYQWYSTDGELSPREIAGRFWDLLQAGVASPA